MSKLKTRRVLPFVLPLLLFVAAAWIAVNRQTAIDHVVVWFYEPTSEVAGFSTRSGMNDRGTFLYYSGQPSIESTQKFNSICGKQDQHANILGCYTNNRIYVYDVSNSQLDGIREVTAAHEMLHAAYERLSTRERNRVDTLLVAEYDRLKDDKALSERMAFYAKTEPGQRNNELHSIIGTEVEAISSELEQYYSEYFTNRHKVTSLHAAYVSVFTSLESRASDLNAQLKSLMTTIEQNSNAYNNAVNQLNADIANFNARAEAGTFSNASDFNNQRAVLVTRASQLNDMRTDINTSITLYQSLRSELESISAQSDSLNKSIDSSLAPAPSL